MVVGVAQSATPHRPAGPMVCRCAICGQEVPEAEVEEAGNIRLQLAKFIAARHPSAWNAKCKVCWPCLNSERASYIVTQLEQERGALSAVEADVARKAARHEWIAENVDKELRSNTTYGQRLADKVAAVGGSWAFIIGFTVFLVLWMTINTVILVNRPFDPYPFILLNLCLSTLAALQAPVIMMSQNRLSEIDRKKADMDYRINLKAEIEVASLHEKLDHLLNVQWERMVEMQQLQFEVLSQLAQKHQCEVPPVRHRRDGWAENGQQH